MLGQGVDADSGGSKSQATTNGSAVEALILSANITLRV